MESRNEDCNIGIPWVPNIPPKNIKPNAEVFNNNMNTYDGVNNNINVNTSSVSKDNPRNTVVFVDSSSKMCDNKDAPQCTATEIPATENIKEEKKERDVDPKTLPLYKLLQKLDYNILYSSFAKLLQFLDGNSQECCFPLINKYYDDVFRRIARDVKVLYLHCWDAHYRDICDKILLSVNFHRDKYYVACVYECRAEYSDVLVFKKVYFKKPSLPSQPTPVSNESSSTESMEVSQSSSSTDLKELLKWSNFSHNVTIPFKVCFLKVTQAFIEDDAKRNVEFIDLNMEQAQYVHTLLSSMTSEEGSHEDFETEAHYVPLWGTIKNFRAYYDYKFHLQILGEKMSFVIEKIPKTRMDASNIMNLEIVDIRKLLRKPMKSKKVKKCERIVQFIESLPPAFVMDALNNIIKFMTSEALVAKIVFVPEDMHELKFYREALNFARELDSDPMLNEEYSSRFKRIAELLVDVKCQVPCPRSNEVNEITGIREVQYRKEPRFNIAPQTTQAQSCLKLTKKEKKKLVSNLKLIKKEKNKVVRNFKLTKKEKKKLFSNLTLTKKQKKKLLQKISREKVPNIDGSWRWRPELPEVVPLTGSAHLGGSFSKRDKKYTRLDIVNNEGSWMWNSELPGVPLNASKKVSFKPATEQSDSSESEGESNLAPNQIISFKPATEQSDSSESEDEPSNGSNRQSKKTGEQMVQNIRAERQWGNAMDTESASFTYNNAFDNSGINKLKQALSVPVQSDKAMKMMQGMGWSGGGLGAKGTGITEPIMPVMDIKRGAGLGHVGNTNTRAGVAAMRKNLKNWVAEVNPNPREKTRMLDNNSLYFDATKHRDRSHTGKVFREVLLTTILELLTTDATTEVLTYSSGIMKRERSFLKHVIIAFTNRGKLVYAGLNQVLIDQIHEKLAELPGVVITSNVSENCREITLTKTQTYTDDQMEQFLMTLKDGKQNDIWRMEVVDKNMMTFLETLAPICCTKNVFKTLKFRVLVLLKLLVFVSSDDDELEVPFNKTLRVMQRNCARTAIETLNARILIRTTHPEYALSMEIINNIGDTDLDIVFNEKYTSFTLTKYSGNDCSTNSDKALKKRRVCTILNTEDFTSDLSRDARKNTDPVFAFGKLNEAINVKCQITDNKTTNIKSGVNEKGNAFVYNYNEVIDNQNKMCDNQEVVSYIFLTDHQEEHLIVYDNTDIVTDNTETIIDDTQYHTGDAKKIITDVPMIISNEEMVINVTDKCRAFNIDYDSLEEKSNITEIVIDNTEIYDPENTVFNIEITNPDTANGSIEITDSVTPIGSTELVDPDTPSVSTKITALDAPSNSTDTSDLESLVSSSQITDLEPSIGSADIYDPRNPIDSTKMSIYNTVKVINGTDKIGISAENVNKAIAMNNARNIIYSTSITSDITETKETSEKYIDLPAGVPSTDNLNIRVSSDKPDTEIGFNESLEIVHMSVEKDSMNLQINEPMGGICTNNRTAKINKVKDETVVILYDDNDIMRAEKAKLIDETDYVALSDQKCDREHLEVSNLEKRDVRTKDLIKNNKVESQFHCDMLENKYFAMRNVYVVPINYPKEKINKQKAIAIQKLISTAIEKTKEELPLLMCHGVHNGALIYTCHTKNTLGWLRNTMSVARDLKVLQVKSIQRMALKFYCLFEFDIKYLFKMLELYNKELSTKAWVVEKIEYYKEHAIFFVKMDQYSINYIHASNLALFAGVDKVEFNLIWDGINN